MNRNSRVTLRWASVAAAAIALLAVGAGTTYLLMQRSVRADRPMQDVERSANATSAGSTQPSNAGGDSP